MKPENVNRRDFSKWTMAAFGGFMSGAVIGCNDSKPTPKTAETSTDPSGGEETSEVVAHACRGLNDCKSANNDCRGQGTCATESWHHKCVGENDCKGQGGCGSAPLTNDCTGKGACHIPLMEPAWEAARKDLEAKWTKAGEAYEDSPAPKS